MELTHVTITAVILATILLHIIADFHLQGILADLKQKKWWMDTVFVNGFNHKYDRDYIAALAVHSMEWSLMVHIPIVYMSCMGGLAFDQTRILALTLAMSVVVHAVLHAVIDHLKCNMLKINLVQDQLLHTVQLVLVIAVPMMVIDTFI